MKYADTNRLGTASPEVTASKGTVMKSVQIKEDVNKLDGLAPLVANPSWCNSTNRLYLPPFGRSGAIKEAEEEEDGVSDWKNMTMMATTLAMTPA